MNLSLCLILISVLQPQMNVITLIGDTSFFALNECTRSSSDDFISF